MTRWSIRKRHGQWRVFDRDLWHDTFPTLEEAHTYATQQAVTDEIFEPGGLTRLKAMINQHKPCSRCTAGCDNNCQQDWCGTVEDVKY